MKILEILRNPLIKAIGIITILYFGLFSNKSNPDSLGSRLSSEKIKKNFSEAKEKSKFIITSVQSAQEAAKEQKARQDLGNISAQNSPKTSTEDLDIGEGEDSLSCGSEAEIIYSIYGKDDKQLESPSKPEKLLIGSNKNQMVESNIIGMKTSGIRIIKIPQDFQTNDKKLSELLKFYQTDLKYQITLLSFTKDVDPAASCK